MKRIINILLVVFVFLTISGCEKYLDEPKPTDQLTSEAIYSSRDGVNAYIDRLFKLIERRDEQIEKLIQALKISEQENANKLNELVNLLNQSKVKY